MSEFLKIEVTGQEALFAALDGLTERVTDLRFAWPAVNKVFEALERRQFDSQGGLTGGWASLTEYYAKWKARRYPGKGVEGRTGALRKSLTDANDPNAIYDPQPDSFTRGSSLPYALAQNSGVPSRNLVARALIAVNDESASEMVKAVMDELAVYARGVGLAA